MKSEVPLLFRVYNVSLRSIILLTRFLLIILLANFLSVGELADYGVFTSVLAYLLYVVGLDFYVFTTREIIKKGITESGSLIKAQLFLNSWMFVFCCLGFLLFHYWLDWGVTLSLIFLPLLILEYLNQELSRFLVIMSRPILATFLTFIRQAFWVILIAIIFYLQSDFAKLEWVLFAWLISGILALTLGIKAILDFNISGWSQSVSIEFFKKGLMISGFMLLGTLSLRGTQTFDRLILEGFEDDIFLASYVIAFGIASVLPVFIDSGLLVFTYPKLLKSIENQDFEVVVQMERNLFLNIVIVVIIYTSFAVVFTQPFLNILNKSEYVLCGELLPYLLSAFVIYSLGLTSHYALYGRNLDKVIVLSQFLGLLVFLLFALLLTDILGAKSILWAIIASFSVITFIKITFHLWYLDRIHK